MEVYKMRFLRLFGPFCGLMLMVLGMGNVALGDPPLPSIPEIDPASIGGALTLLIGGMLVLSGSRKK